MSNRKFTVVNRSKSYTNRKTSMIDDDKDYEDTYNADKERISKEIKIIEKFVARICRSFVDNMVKTERNNQKYCVLFKYNDDPDKGELYNDRIEGLDTKYILSGKWIPMARQFFDIKKCRSVKYRLSEYIKSKEFNGGVDPITDRPYQISVFHYKGGKSVFQNGIIISRDGISYN